MLHSRMDTKDLITTTEAAAILDCDPSAIRHRIRSGTLKSEVIGRDNLVSRKAVVKIKSGQNGTKKRGPKPKKG